MFPTPGFLSEVESLKPAARSKFSVALTAGFILPLVLFSPTSIAPHAPSDAERVEMAVAYLAGLYRAGQKLGANPADVIEALAQAGVDPKAWPDPSIAIFARNAPQSTDDYQRYKDGLRAGFAAATSGYDPRDVNGVDYVQSARARFVAGQFGDVTFNNDDVWSVILLRAAGVPASDEMVAAGVRSILNARSADGGWSHYVAAVNSDVDSTGMALMALAMAGHDLSGEMTRSLAFVESLRGSDGGYDNSKSNALNRCQSTVWAIRAHQAAGADAPEMAFDFLRKQQAPHGDGSLSGGKWCTVEAIPVLANARAPFPSYHPALPAIPTGALAGETARFSVTAPFTQARWTVAGVIVEGTAPQMTFEAPGTYSWSLLAEGPGVRAREDGTVDVRAARPILRIADAPPSTVARHTPITLDARASAPGVLHIDWGDGNATQHPERAGAHAYDAPGPRSIRARIIDPQGIESDTTTFLVTLANRAPTFSEIPTRVRADRVHPFTIAPQVMDLEGDLTTISWTYGNATGMGVLTATPSTLGDAQATFVARDQHGATSWRNVTVQVINLEPTLAALSLPTYTVAGSPFTFSVEAHDDDDGPAPRVVWQFGETRRNGTQGELALTDGTYEVTVTATDADGGSVHAVRMLRVLPPGAIPHESAEAGSASVENVTATLAHGVLRVRFAATPIHGPRTLSWVTDIGQGETVVYGNEATIPLDGATRARVTVETRVGNMSARAHSPLTLAPPAATPIPVNLDVLNGHVLEGERVDFHIQAAADAWIRVDFGDGNQTSARHEVRTFHRYANTGSYRVLVEAVRPNGEIATAQSLIQVDTPPASAPSTTADAFATVIPGTPPGEPTHADIFATSEERRDAPVAAPLREVPAASFLVAALVLLGVALTQRRN